MLAELTLVDPAPIVHASASYQVSPDIAARLDALSAHQLVALQSPNPGFTLQVGA